MTPADPPPAGTVIDWTPDGQPRSRQFGDVYFSAEDGLAESRAVFLAGCGLPGAWQGRSSFVVGELGFGCGLNVAALLELWGRTRPAGGVLNIFSIEASPFSADEAARALSRWPELSEIVALLTARWPGRARGRHRVEFPEFGAILDLAVVDVAEALEGWSGRADAWFLDGFSPALNPAMWKDEVLALVAARSAPGARAATFTVAGQVRRGLATAGFEVEKQPGFGRKRERLEAKLPGRPGELRRKHVAIIGAGIAGAAAARAVRALGATAIVVEAEHPGAGGSGNPGALVTPRLDAGLGEAARLFAGAFARAVRLYEDVSDAVLHRGVLQIAADERDAARFALVAASDVFEPGSLQLLAADALPSRLGEAGPSTPGPALDQTDALVIDPLPILTAWTGDVRTARVAGLEADGDGWRLMDATGAEIVRADAVIVAAAMGSGALIPELHLRPVRGQASWTEDGAMGPAASWGGYVLPIRQGLLFGATHDRGDEGADLRDADHGRNLRTLGDALPNLAARIAPSELHGRAAVRAATPDGSPIAGATHVSGVYVLSGLGSRGFSLAPLLAEHVAALALDAPSPISAAAADLLAPDRFARRAARRADTHHRPDDGKTKNAAG